MYVSKHQDFNLGIEFLLTKGWSQGFCESEIKDSDLTHKIDSIKLLQEIFKREHINALLNISF